MNEIVKQELGAGVRLCRECGKPFVGYGALCETHRAELAVKRAQENAQVNAALDARIAAGRKAKRMRRRVEWVEAV